MKEEILTRYYVGLLLVAFLTLIFPVGILKAILFSVLITVVKYLFDKYVMSYLNPYIDKFYTTTPRTTAGQIQTTKIVLNTNNYLKLLLIVQ